ncbi:MAG: hypothetical protein ABMA13_00340 [Chthoniobacteraceae bacterium]
MPPPTSPLRSPAASIEWRKNDFTAYAVGHDEQGVMLRGEAPHLLPGFIVDFVNSCDDFAPIERHIARYAERHAWGSLEADALRSWLPRVTDSRLMVSATDVLAACARHTAPPPPPIATIGFPTGGDRVDLVGRALASFAGNARTYDRRVEFLVADSSAAPAQRAAFREAGSGWAKMHDVRVRYAGDEEKRRLSAELVLRGIAPDAVEFALFDPLAIGFACGANRNALLLHEAGRMFCSIDDDVVCELAAAPPVDARLKLFSSCDPFTRWLFGDRAAALAHAGTVEADFLGSHEALLGRGLAELGAGVEVGSLDVSQVGDDFLRRLWVAQGRVRASFSGHAGDPGVPTSIYYLYYEGENRRRFTESEAAYRAALASRSVFALAPCAAVGDSSTSPGMAMGLDHRELLPPFFPVLHAEDFTYGATLWQTVGDAFLAHAPLAVRHDPRPGKTILQPRDLGPERRAVVFEFSHLIRRIILRFQRHESAAPAERMRQLGRHLASLAAQPPADFVECIRGQLLEHESAKLDRLEEELREDTTTRDWWRDDLEVHLAHVRDALTHDDFDIPFDMKCDRSDAENRVLMQELFARFGLLLEAWPDLVSAAREINATLDWMPAL